MKTIPWQDKQIEVEDVDVLHSDEGWNSYQLAGGEVLVVKTVLIEALRAVSERTQDGEPLYIVKTHCHVKVKK